MIVNISVLHLYNLIMSVNNNGSLFGTSFNYLSLHQKTHLHTMHVHTSTHINILEREGGRRER